MSAKNGPQDAEFESASSQLNEGLKSCRAMVENYRAMLSGDNENEVASNDDEAYVSGSELA